MQQRGADSSAALSYYSAVVSALVAIAGETVSIPTFGQFASVNYTYGIGTMPSPASKATVSKWVYGNAVRRSPSPTQTSLTCRLSATCL